MSEIFTLPAPYKMPIVELAKFEAMISKSLVFTFVRFSDGECEILNGNRLEISDSGVDWSRGASSFIYPRYDFKSFDPNRDNELMKALLESAQYRAPAYFKGIPTAHNNAQFYSKQLYELNGSSCEGLTFSDLFVNSNYRKFLSGLFVKVKSSSSVALIGNYRMDPSLVSSSWRHHKVGDDLFQQFQSTVNECLEFIRSLPPYTIVLSSASSISNIVGHMVHQEGIPVTFIDVGTALHPLMGLPDSRREYQSQLEKWRPGTFRQKLGYHLGGSSKIRW